MQNLDEARFVMPQDWRLQEPQVGDQTSFFEHTDEIERVCVCAQCLSAGFSLVTSKNRRSPETQVEDTRFFRCEYNTTEEEAERLLCFCAQCLEGARAQEDVGAAAVRSQLDGPNPSKDQQPFLKRKHEEFLQLEPLEETRIKKQTFQQPFPSGRRLHSLETSQQIQGVDGFKEASRRDSKAQFQCDSEAQFQ